MNLASATPASNNDAESFRLLIAPQETRSVITVDVASTNRRADYWVQDTGAMTHVTGNQHLFESFQPMPKGEHQVKTASNSLIDAVGTDDSTSQAMDQSRPEPSSPVQIQCKEFLDWDRTDPRC